MSNNLGISVDIKDPVFTTGNFQQSLIDELISYSQEIAALGGYKSATFSLKGSLADMEEWFEYGLGRDITARDEGGGIIWNGFVNKISISFGGRSIERGPLMDISNRVAVSYAPLDTSISPPAVGNKTITPYAEDTESQGKYGILTEIFSADRVTPANAITIRDTLLRERKDPETTESVASQNKDPLIAIEALGYFEYLNRFIYSSAASGTVSVSSKIATILAAEPNSLFPASASSITENTLITAIAETEAKGWSALIGLVAKGDSSSNRYTMGVYKDRGLIYAPVPTAFDYQYRVSESRLEIFGSGEVFPWDILPARWIFFTDFMAGKTLPSTNRADPRALFIESVSYTAPADFAISGGKVKKLPQLLARLGLKGSA